MTGRAARITIGGVPRIVDLYYSLPTFPHLKVTDYGAVGDDSTDNQTALTNAIAAAKAAGLPLCVPPGIYRHSGRLTVNGVVIFGVATRSCILKGTTVDAHAIDLTGTGPQLHNLTIMGPGKSPRTSNRGGNGVYVNACTGYVIRNCRILNVSGAGIMGEDAHNGLVRNCQVEITGADGIYHTEGTTNLEVAYNKTITTGDDALSVTSYDTALGFCSNVTFHHNTVVGNFESRAISVNGCDGGIVVRDNHIDGGTSGVSVSSVTEWGTKHSTGVEVYGNTIRNINQTRQDTGTIGGGALSFWNDVSGASGPTTPTLTQSKAANGTGTSLAVTLTTAPTAGNLLVGYYYTGNANSSTATFTTPSGWTKVAAADFAAPIAIYAKIATGAETTTTFAHTATSTAQFAIVEEWNAGTAFTGTVPDASGSASAGSGQTAITVTAGTGNAQANELEVAAIGFTNGGTISSWGTFADGDGINAGTRLHTASRTATSSETAAVTITGSFSSPRAAVATFRLPASTPGGGSDTDISMHDNQIYNPGLYGIFAGGSSPITATVSTNAFYIDPGKTLYNSANPSASITLTSNTTPDPNTYPGDLVPVTVGGLDPTYRFAP